eukprot:CAMPEP_0171459506 /NCGR_PEP_ID=MMETSP0945-20130129/4764_1 /TAXON_ID=109269 /ORGANISM="Vaucheria litorea, Strain CCMP2940" /LENGTH=620 /DNA_ID=CAMNT_0011985541 /DNA_START=166 /DNA_END=2028 /DNA_ORIENTATION=+
MMNPCRNVTNSSTYHEILLKNPLKLKRLPIPSLEDTVQRWLSSVQPHFNGSSDEWSHFLKMVKDFEIGDGKKMNESLMKKEETDIGKGQARYPYSYIEECWDDMYLKGRWALPINSNPYLALQPPPKSYKHISLDHQVSSAVSFIDSHLKYLCLLKNDDFENDENICSYQHTLQVGSGRIASRCKDFISYNPESKHIVVIVSNRAYKVKVLYEDNAQIKPNALVDLLEDLKSKAKTLDRVDAFVGYMTSMDRDSWAENRAKLKSISRKNAKSLKALDSALLVVSLEDDSESTGSLHCSSKARHFLFGKHGENRWFDKHQLCVTTDGSMAVNYEHSYSDGMAWCRNLGEIWHDMYGVPSKLIRSLPKGDYNNEKPEAIELEWDLSTDLKNEIFKAQNSFKKSCEGLGLNVMKFDHFGKEHFKNWKISPDAGVQMAIQASFYNLHKKFPAVYESASTNRFLHGRTETIRSATNESLLFIKALQPESSLDNESKKELFVKAMNKHIVLAREAASGLGVDRHLAAMRYLAQKNAKSNLGHDFYNHPLYLKSSKWLCSTSNVSNPFLSAFGFGPVVDNGYGLGYIIHNESIPIVVTNFEEGETDSKDMSKGIENALLEIQNIFEK